MKQFHNHLVKHLAWYRKWHQTPHHTVVHYGLFLGFLIFVGASLASYDTVQAVGSTYYVSPSGSANASGTISAPWSLSKLSSVILAPGDVVYLRGGTYRSTASNPANAGTHLLIHDQQGTSANPITIQAYPGEKPILDLSNFTTTNADPTAVRIQNTNYLKLKGLRITGLKQIPSGSGVSRGLELSNSHNNTIEQVEVDHIGGYGFITDDSNNNLFLNDDAHHLDDRYTTDGGAWGNANGFQSTGEGNTSTGNVYDGCRAWAISDDGFDMYGTDGLVTIRNSWAFWNGYTPSLTDNSVTFTPTGDGDGFKLGPDSSRYPPYVVVYHNQVRRILSNNIAFENKQHGFNQNAGDLRMQLYNNTAYKNGQKGFMWGLVENQPQDDFKNNISYANGTAYNGSAIIGSKNTWSPDLSVTLNNADFQSLSSVGMDGPRNADGSLPVLPYLKLASNSDLIDKGVNVGLPFSGSLPDIGAYESTGITQDTTAPVVSILAPLTNSTISGTIPLSAQASDNTAVTRVEFYQGSTLLSTLSTAPYTTTWNTTTIANGTYTLTAKAYDAAGNVGTASVNVTVGNADTVAPVVSITAPANGTSVASGVVVPMTARATDNIAISKVEFYRGSTLIGTQTSGPNSDFNLSWDTTGVATGTYSLTAKAYDTAGNTATSSAVNITLTAPVDVIAPTVSITNSGGYYASFQRITLKATANDNVGISKVQFLIDGNVICNDSSSPYTCSWSVPFTKGSFIITAKAYDAAGNTGTSAGVKITNINRKVASTYPGVTATATPTQTITLPTNSVTLSGSYTTDSLSTTVRWTKISGSGTITSPNTTTTTITELTEGTSSFLFSVDNGAGTNATATSVVIVNSQATNTISFAQPVVLSGKAAGSTISGNVSVELASVTSANPITKVEFYRGTTLIGIDNTYAPYSISTGWNTQSVANGVYSFTAKAYDSAGNTATTTPVSMTIAN